MLLQIFLRNFYSNASCFSLVWLYLGNSQVSVDRTIGPTLVIIIITSVSSKFTDFLLLTDVCQQHIFRIFAIDFHNLSFPQTTNR